MLIKKHVYKHLLRLSLGQSSFVKRQLPWSNEFLVSFSLDTHCLERRSRAPLHGHFASLEESKRNKHSTRGLVSITNFRRIFFKRLDCALHTIVANKLAFADYIESI